MQILVAHPVLGNQQLWGPAVCVLTSGQWCSCCSLRTTALNNHQWTHGFQLLESSLHFCNLNLILSFKDIRLPNFYIFDLVSKLFFQSHNTVEGEMKKSMTVVFLNSSGHQGSPFSTLRAALIWKIFLIRTKRNGKMGPNKKPSILQFINCAGI